MPEIDNALLVSVITNEAHNTFQNEAYDNEVLGGRVECRTNSSD